MLWLARGFESASNQPLRFLLKQELVECRKGWGHCFKHRLKIIRCFVIPNGNYWIYQVLAEVEANKVAGEKNCDGNNPCTNQIFIIAYPAVQLSHYYRYIEPPIW